MKVSLVYISLSGNTESFVRRLSDYLLEQHPSLEIEKIHIKDLVKEGRPFFEMTNSFRPIWRVAMVWIMAMSKFSRRMWPILLPMGKMLASVLELLEVATVTLITSTA